MAIVAIMRFIDVFPAREVHIQFSHLAARTRAAFAGCQ